MAIQVIYPGEHLAHELNGLGMFGTTPEFWLKLQNLYELRLAQKKAGKSISRR